jgi:hypothetical protein
MTILTADISHKVKATRAWFAYRRLFIELNDGREISIPLDKFPWLNWLANATEQQRNRWHIEPGGFAVYWDDLDDGIEIEHLLEIEPLT